jgi:D-sedoheptulose 7-phosphate isomerase
MSILSRRHETPAVPPTPCDHEHLQELSDALARFSGCVDVVDRWGVQLAEVLTGGGRLLAAGNGGSAAQAQHLTAELVGRYRHDRSPFSAICLSAETSSLTAICNDYPASELFARQVEAHGRPGDVLMLMSTSGRSENLVAAARRGRAAGLHVWSMTGPLPNPLAEHSTGVCAVDAQYTATVQELHLVALHMTCAALDRTLGVGASRTRVSPSEDAARPSGAA